MSSGRDPTWAEVLLSAAADSQVVHPLEYWDYLQVLAGLRRAWDLEHPALLSRLVLLVFGWVTGSFGFELPGGCGLLSAFGGLGGLSGDLGCSFGTGSFGGGD